MNGRYQSGPTDTGRAVLTRRCLPDDKGPVSLSPPLYPGHTVPECARNLVMAVSRQHQAKHHRFLAGQRCHVLQLVSVTLDAYPTPSRVPLGSRIGEVGHGVVRWIRGPTAETATLPIESHLDRRLILVRRDIRGVVPRRGLGFTLLPFN